MLAPAALPAAYQEWNREYHAPFGRELPPALLKILGPRHPIVLRYRSPYAWQPNSTIRRFEYPWVFEQIQELEAD